ncbi:MAG: type II/IV secretion system protein, partial [Planctomycetaceae bacterium]|nr:type II/IV secretion system protein [Planctomycetaceae bacterium]
MEIGGLLLQRGLIDQQQMESARSKANGKRVDQILVEMGAIKEEDALRALGEELGIPYVDLKNFQVDLPLISRFPTTAIFRHEVLPLEATDGRVRMATSDPFDLEALDELSSLGGCRVDLVLACRQEIVDLIKGSLGVGGDTINELVAQRSEEGIELLDDLPSELGELAEEAQAASVIRLVNELLIEALEQRASDVHVEPGEHGLTIRYRIDGMLR